MTEPLLSLNNIEVLYDDVILVLRGLSLEVGEGRIVALLGSNGAGKSTTLKAISGLLYVEDGEISDGTIVFDGEEIQGMDAHRIVEKGVFQVLEGRRVFEHLTVRENLLAGGYTRGSRRGLVLAGLDEVEDVLSPQPALGGRSPTLISLHARYISPKRRILQTVRPSTKCLPRRDLFLSIHMAK